MSKKVRLKHGAKAQIRNPTRNFEQDKDKDYWDQPDQQYPAFIKFEETMLELKEDYRKDNKDISEGVL